MFEVESNASSSSGNVDKKPSSFALRARPNLDAEKVAVFVNVVNHILKSKNNLRYDDEYHFCAFTNFLGL